MSDGLVDDALFLARWAEKVTFCGIVLPIAGVLGELLRSTLALRAAALAGGDPPPLAAPGIFAALAGAGALAMAAAYVLLTAEVAAVRESRMADVVAAERADRGSA